MDCRIFSTSPNVEVTIDSLLDIAEAETCSDGTRRQAFQLAVRVALSEHTNSSALVSAYIRHWARIILRFMSDINDFQAWYKNGSDNPSLDIWPIGFNLMKVTLQEIVTAAGGGGVLFPILCNDFRSYLDNRDWQMRHAVLIAMAELCTQGFKEDELVPSVEKMINLILDSVTDKHPRVRWAAASALKQLAVGFSKSRQKYRVQVADVLVPVIEREDCARVQVRLRAALHEFS